LNPQLKRYYLFLGASLVFSIGLQIGLGYLGVPWYFSIGLVMAIFILLPMIMRRQQMNRMGSYGSGSGTGGEEAPVAHDMFALFATTNTKEELVHDVVPKCKRPTFS
jgi:hypothetical protein